MNEGRNKETSELGKDTRRKEGREVELKLGQEKKERKIMKKLANLAKMRAGKEGREIEGKLVRKKNGKKEIYIGNSAYERD